MALVDVNAFADRVKLDLDPNGQDDRLPDIQLALDQAETIVLTHAKMLDHEWTVEDVPGDISASIMMVAQCLIDDSKDASLIAGIDSDLKNPVGMMLRKYRTPTLA
jgi:hypothetical protein